MVNAPEDYICFEADYDLDGLLDDFEGNITIFNGNTVYSDPIVRDTDVDGLYDGQEITCRIEPGAEPDEVFVFVWLHSDPNGDDSNADALAYTTSDSFIGLNLFAYAENNSINNVDATGNIAIPLIKIVEIAGVIIIIAMVGNTIISATKCSTAATRNPSITYAAPISLPKISIKANEKEVTKTVKAKAIYYGADIKGGSWRKVTRAMTLSQAVTWVKKASTNSYGKNASWGVYTLSMSDAYVLGITLGNLEPKPDIVRGCFPHFHMKGHVFYGKYNHFHLWYGSIVS